MPALTVSALRGQLNTGAAGPLYLLVGDDDAAPGRGEEVPTR